MRAGYPKVIQRKWFPHFGSGISPFLIWFALLSLPFPAAAQVSFEKVNPGDLTTDFRSGVAVGVSDLNGNFRDDLFRQHMARFLHVDFQLPNGGFQKVAEGLSISPIAQWNITAGDFNRDGLLDIVSAGNNDGLNVFRQTEFGQFTRDTVINFPGFFAQSANVIDIDNDGYLDLFVCDDLAESKIYGNSGDGSFFDAGHWINMETEPPSDNSGNYGSVWSDVTGNGKMDLYISKCKPGVGNPADPRRINALFINQGNGEFTEAAAGFGIANGGQSWASDFGDINNNGLVDLITLNHQQEVVLYLNEGNGQFTDITLGSGLVHPDFGMQVKFADFDNDGYLDILISGFNHFLYLNNGDNTFSLVSNPFDANQISTFALGDLNDNGFVDVYAGHTVLYNRPPGPVDDAIWINTGNSNNWLRFKLRGLESNRNGIGAILHAYSSLGKQTREIRSGESFGIQNSNIAHFGLGQLEELDSLVVSWPSGQRDVYQNLQANQKILLTEGVCRTTPFDLEVQGNLFDCSGNGVLLSGPEGFEYQWNTGEESRSLEVNEMGMYYLTAIDPESGCVHLSESVFYDTDPDLKPRFAENYPSRICRGEGLILQVESPAEITWQDGTISPEYEPVESGVYYAFVDGGDCGIFFSDTLEIEVLDVDPPLYTGPFEFHTSEVELTAEGEEVRWYLEENGIEADHSGVSFNLLLPMGEHRFYIANAQFFPGTPHRLGKEKFEGNSPYPASHINGGLLFDLEQDIRLETVVLFTDFDGVRKLEVYNENEELVAEKEVDLENAAEGQRVTLDWQLPAGKGYRMTTNSDVNLQNLGFTGPRLMRSEVNVSFPYQIDGVAEIQSSTFGAQYYYYFYDWEITSGERKCESERIAVDIVVDSTSSVDPNLSREKSGLNVFPNPAGDLVHFQLEGSCGKVNSWELVDAQGKISRTEVDPNPDESGHTITLDGMASGFYILIVKACGKIYHRPVIIAR